MVLETATLYNADGNTIVVNVTDVEEFKEKGFSTRRKKTGDSDKPKAKKDNINIED